MGLQKAKIEILDPGAVDGLRGLPAVIPVQFNPSEYSLTKGTQIAEIAIPGLDSPLLQFVAGQNEKLTLDLYFDTTREGMGDSARDVREHTRMIYQLVKVQPDTHSPPRVRFTWDANLKFESIVESVTQKFTLFNPNGVPLRATVSVTFREYKTLDQQLKELNLRSPDHTRLHVVVEGETLALIAAEKYGHSRYWRVIADNNAVRLPNPRLLSPGLALELPRLDDTNVPAKGALV